jgi:molybdopterin-guanine dinucleotide biosynthesis protein A
MVVGSGIAGIQASLDLANSGMKGSDLEGSMSSPLPVTGILLLGGASERFGSPKALATIRGETLAERAWRVLAAVCDEVLAVGKVADALELAFDVVDDGEEERAPVFGVIAGLRAASHETCLVLPVDCPLVTPELLRKLVVEGAVAETGPLPGTYTKAMLVTLEERVERGELSLKGVNPTAIHVDDELLLNVNTPTDLVAAISAALDDGLGDRPVLPPDDDALHDLAADFWATALWAARRLRKGDVFLAVDAVNGAMKRSVVTLLGWHALSVDPDASVLEAGRQVERWADPGALTSLERAYADYDLRDVARALWETIDLFQGLQEETARRLQLDVELEVDELRRRIAAIVRDPRRRATL